MKEVDTDQADTGFLMRFAVDSNEEWASQQQMIIFWDLKL